MHISKNQINSNITKLVIGEDLNEDGKPVNMNTSLDIHNQSFLVDMVNDILEHSVTNDVIFVDLFNVSYIDSSGLWALIDANKKALNRNCRFVIFNLQEDVLRILEITKMISRLVIASDEESALKLVAE